MANKFIEPFLEQLREKEKEKSNFYVNQFWIFTIQVSFDILINNFL